MPGRSSQAIAAGSLAHYSLLGLEEVREETRVEQVR